MFLKLGEAVPGTKFRLAKFEFKTRTDSKGAHEDVSELTLQDVETKELTVLILGRR